MNKEIFEKVIAIVSPFATNKEALEKATESSDFLTDLKVSSARLVDIILAIEDTFDIEVGDDEADSIETIGAAVSVIEAKLN